MKKASSDVEPINAPSRHKVVKKMRIIPETLDHRFSSLGSKTAQLVSALIDSFK
ncbi:hypothetical protein HMPREF3037_02281 [Candidatus Stoquefichus sp. KLE1796]|nr:hypothetical protein HMPREF3037_02281 [Candidatus Stoquefichus sp. KLE1796]